MKLFFVSLFLFMTIAVAAQKPQEHNGCLFGLMLDTLCGKVTFNLYGENKEMVSVETQTITKGKGRKTTETLKSSFYPGIANVKLGNVMYYFINVKEDYKVERTALALQKVMVKGDLALYKWTDEKGQDSYYIKLSKDDTPRNIMHPYLDKTSSIIIWGCMPLMDKIRAKTPGFYYEDMAPLENRLSVWQKIIEESTQCPPKG